MKTFEIERRSYNHSYDVSIFENNEIETYLVTKERIHDGWRSGYGDTTVKAVARFLYSYGAKVFNGMVSKGKVDVTFRNDIPLFNFIGFKKSIEYILNKEEEKGDDLYSFWRKCEQNFIKDQKEKTVLLPFAYHSEDRACYKYSKAVAEKYSGEYLKPYLNSCDFCPFKKGCKKVRDLNDHDSVSCFKKVLKTYLDELELEDYVVETKTDNSIFSKVEFDKTKWKKEISAIEDWIFGRKYSFYSGEFEKYLDYNVCDCARINEKFSYALKYDYPINRDSDNYKDIYSKCRTCPLACENLEGNKKGFLCEKNSYFKLAIKAKQQGKNTLAEVFWEEFKNSLTFKPYVSFVESEDSIDKNESFANSFFSKNPFYTPCSSIPTFAFHKPKTTSPKKTKKKSSTNLWTKKEVNLLVKTLKNNPQKGVFKNLAKKLNRSEEAISRKCRREFGTSDISVLSKKL